MAERYACHVFTHSEGRYQTIHAVGVSPEELRQLEQFFFGQTSDLRYLESLCDEPGMIWRRIGSRISLTRVSRGERDAHDRSTLRFESLLADSTNAALRSQVAELCAAKWRFSVDGVAVTARQPTPSGPVNADRISEVVLAARDGSRVVVPADELTLDDASRIIRHAADIPGFSLCYKSLNKQAPVLVNIVALAVSEIIKVKSKRNPVPMSRQPSRSSAQRAGPQSGTTLMLAVILVAFVVQTIILWKVAGAPSGESQDSEMQVHILTRIDAESSKQMDKIDDVVSKFQKRFDEQRSENDRRFVQLEDLIKKQDDNFAERGKELDRRFEEIKNAVDESIDGVAKRLQEDTKRQLEKMSNLISTEHDKLRKKLKPYLNSEPTVEDISDNGNGNQ